MASRDAVNTTSLLSAVSTGLIIAVTGLMVGISFAALIFSGPLSTFLPAGIGYVLFGSLVIGVVVAVLSSFPHSIGFVQDTPTVILGVMAASLARAMAERVPADSLFYSVVALMALASLATGLLFFLLGTFKLGNLVRYVPYPVIGGFLAGTGWLLADGAINVMTGSGLSPSALPGLLQPEVLRLWLPGLALAVSVLFTLRRYSHPLLLPGLLIGTIVLFHVGLLLFGVSPGAAREAGFLLGPFPEGGLWQPLTPAALQQVEWGSVLGQSGTLATLVLIALLSLLLNASGLELVVQREIDLNRELKVTGIANALSGLGGGPVGYQALSLSALSHKLTPLGRVTGVVVALCYGGALLVGTSFLGFFPTFVLGGLLLLLGLDFLVTWLYDTWRHMARTEYAIVVAIALAMVTVGVLEGVAFGLFLAMVLFVVDYGRTSPVRRVLSGETFRSNVDRAQGDRRLLQQEGQQLFILELQRFIFFGTANRLFEAVRRRLAAPDIPPPRFVILDFRRVSGLDASAISSFAKMKQLAAQYGLTLLFTSLTEQMERQLAPQLFDTDDEDMVRRFPDLDHAVEWAEERMLADHRDRSAATIERELAAADRPDGIADLIPFMDTRHLAAGDYLIRQGEPPQGLYYLASGQLTARLEYPDGRTVRLRRMQPGVFIGELSLYANAPASASVVADEPSEVCCLPVEELSRLEREEPAVAATFHRRIAQLASERLLDATATMSALMQ